ncbi:MAG: hypothetical protein KC618_06525 [Candidatus Omnitrophica bacterium]|nr:hypothetical protein [Candidatus Omnitrophota bacterium]
MVHRFISVKTERSVHQLKDLLLKSKDWKLDKEVDSMNFGEGYDLYYLSVPVRLYDEERTDAAILRMNTCGGSWEDNFKTIQKQYKDKAVVEVVVDYDEQCSKDEVEKTAGAIKNLLLKNGFSEEKIECY